MSELNDWANGLAIPTKFPHSPSTPSYPATTIICLLTRFFSLAVITLVFICCAVPVIPLSRCSKRIYHDLLSVVDNVQSTGSILEANRIIASVRRKSCPYMQSHGP